MSQILPPTPEEIREWEEAELQRKRVVTKEFIQLGLPISPGHERWRQIRAAAAAWNNAAPVARGLLTVAENSKPDWWLDSTADLGEAQLGGRDPQRSFIGHSPANDGSFQNLSDRRPTIIDRSARSDFPTSAQLATPSITQARATNGYSKGENVSLPQNPSPRDLTIPQGYSASASPAAQSAKSQPAKTNPSPHTPGRQSHSRTSPSMPPVNRVDKYNHPISMYSSKSGDWHVLIAKLDSGSEENWVAQEVVDRLRLKLVRGPRKWYKTFNCEDVSSDATVKSIWCAKGELNTHEHVFRVIDKAPFDVLFGNTLLDSEEVQWFRKKPASDPVLVLAATRIDKKEREEIKQAKRIAVSESAALSRKALTIKDSKVPIATRKTSPELKDAKKIDGGKKHSKKSGQ